ncbi:MAG: DoxX family protein [Planctomycetota bacterium]
MLYLKIVLQLIVALGILDVWLLRAGKATPYRGGNAINMREEFAVYGLPYWFMCLIAVLKIGLALSLLFAIWNPSLAQPAGAGLGLLMLAAIIMHFKAKDPLKKALPALAVFVMCALIAVL